LAYGALIIKGLVLFGGSKAIAAYASSWFPDYETLITRSILIATIVPLFYFIIRPFCQALGINLDGESERPGR
jgi:hypothetical protein